MGFFLNNDIFVIFMKREQQLFFKKKNRCEINKIAFLKKIEVQWLFTH
jgi:hypothetical protein